MKKNGEFWKFKELLSFKLETCHTGWLSAPWCCMPKFCKIVQNEIAIYISPLAIIIWVFLSALWKYYQKNLNWFLGFKPLCTSTGISTNVTLNNKCQIYKKNHFDKSVNRKWHHMEASQGPPMTMSQTSLGNPSN